MKIIILGAGLIGQPMAIDLAKDLKYQITGADINETSLKKLKKGHSITTIQIDLSKPENVKSLVQNYDFVINALPGFIGFQTLEAIIEAKKSVVDIAFFAEDPFLLNELAKKQNVVALVDCGVSPGMSNILVAYLNNLRRDGQERSDDRTTISSKSYIDKIAVTKLCQRGSAETPIPAMLPDPPEEPSHLCQT